MFTDPGALSLKRKNHPARWLFEGSLSWSSLNQVTMFGGTNVTKTVYQVYLRLSQSARPTFP